MTNKEAVEELEKVDTLDMPARLCEAHYMSIKALKQESCEVESIKLQQVYNKGFEDCRQAVLDKKELIELEDGQSFYCISPEDVKNIPFVNPQESKWIPVSERLPKENETVMASTEYGVFPEARYTKEYGWEWAYEAGADYWKEFEGVTAWMPLPKPYKAESEE